MALTEEQKKLLLAVFKSTANKSPLVLKETKDKE